jgi:two-component system response regulator FixJ
VNQEPKVFIVDDDDAVRRYIGRLLDQVGIAHEGYPSAEEFLETMEPRSPGCLLLDVRMPGMGGRALQDRLAEKEINLPILFMTGHGEVSMAVEALHKGAVDFLQKPFNDQALLDRVQKAIQQDAEERLANEEREASARRLSQLTPREVEVVDLVLEGLSNKQIAFKLSVSPQAIDARRSNAMKKLGVGSIAELITVVLKSRGES